MRDKEPAYSISIWAIILSVISLAIIIIYAFAKFPNTQYLGFDYKGVIVAIFSVLVTVLICWQIGNTIIANQRIRKLENDWEATKIDFNNKLDKQIQLVASAITDMDTKIKGTKGLSNWAISDMYYTLIEPELATIQGKSYKVDKFYSFLKYALFTISYFSIIDDYSTCNLHINRIIEMIPIGCTRRLKEIEYQDILAAERLIKRNDEKMPDYILMLRRIHQLDPQRPITSSNLS